MNFKREEDLMNTHLTALAVSIIALAFVGCGKKANEKGSDPPSSGKEGAMTAGMTAVNPKPTSSPSTPSRKRARKSMAPNPRPGMSGAPVKVRKVVATKFTEMGELAKKCGKLSGNERTVVCMDIRAQFRRWHHMCKRRFPLIAPTHLPDIKADKEDLSPPAFMPTSFILHGRPTVASNLECWSVPTRAVSTSYYDSRTRLAHLHKRSSTGRTGRRSYRRPKRRRSGGGGNGGLRGRVSKLEKGQKDHSAAIGRLTGRVDKVETTQNTVVLPKLKGYGKTLAALRKANAKIAQRLQRLKQ